MLASAATEIAASRSATVGSVGALIRYIDLEPVFKKMGARVIEVVAAPVSELGVRRGRPVPVRPR